jgi:hypothetical protein
LSRNIVLGKTARKLITGMWELRHDQISEIYI